MATTTFSKPIDDEIAALNNKIETISVEENITAETNLNSCKDEKKIYYINGPRTPINAPANNAYNAIIWNVKGGTYGVQFYFSYNLNKLYCRGREVNTFVSWREL